jgi:hypothetical protein
LKGLHNFKASDRRQSLLATLATGKKTDKNTNLPCRCKNSSSRNSKLPTLPTTGITIRRDLDANFKVTARFLSIYHDFTNAQH